MLINKVANLATNWHEESQHSNSHSLKLIFPKWKLIASSNLSFDKFITTSTFLISSSYGAILITLPSAHFVASHAISSIS